MSSRSWGDVVDSGLDSLFIDRGGEDDTSRYGKRLYLVVGSIALIAGLLVPLVLGLETVPIGMASVVGALGLGAGGWILLLRLRSGPPRAIGPGVGDRSGVTRTGAGFEAAVRTMDASVTGRSLRARNELLDRLRAVAARRVSERRQCDRDTAMAAVRSGDWDAPPLVRAFLATGSPPERSLRDRLRERLGWSSPLLRAVQDTVATVDPAAGRSEQALPLGEPDIGGAREGAWEAGTRSTDRWRGVAGFGLLALGVAALTRTTGPGLVGATLVGLAGYARLFDPPEVSLAVDRSIETATVRPGDSVTVTVTVTNEGGATLPDCRIVDDVPDRLAVVAGSPGHATALRPGERTAFSYDVRAVFGDHRFERCHVRVRDVAGQRERSVAVVDGTTSLTCDAGAVLESMPLHPVGSGIAGRVPADVGGSGLAFRSVRDYRPGDPLGRVAWNRLAKTGDLATRQFEEEHAATVVVLVDTRLEAAIAPEPNALSALDRSLAGAAQAVGSLLDDGDQVGFGTVESDWRWVGPAAGSRHRQRLGTAIQAAATAGATDTPGWYSPARYVDRLRRRLPSSCQLVCFTPLVDSEIAEIVRRLHGHGYPTTVFSPDPTSGATLGDRVVGLERDGYVSDLRTAGVRVVDWPVGDGLADAFERARRGWER